MYLLYIDESGAVDDPSQPFFVLAGIAIFERQTHWVEQKLNDIASRFNPSRLIQLADLIAFSVYRHYSAGDDTLFKLIRTCFDAEGGINHGLYEKL